MKSRPRRKNGKHASFFPRIKTNAREKIRLNEGEEEQNETHATDVQYGNWPSLPLYTMRENTFIGLEIYRWCAKCEREREMYTQWIIQVVEYIIMPSSPYTNLPPFFCFHSNQTFLQGWMELVKTRAQKRMKHKTIGTFLGDGARKIKSKL